MSFVFSADAATQGADQGEADVELLGWEELREACPTTSTSTPCRVLEDEILVAQGEDFFIVGVVELANPRSVLRTCPSA